jgi:hypothetical protein
LSSEHVERRLAAILASDVAGSCRLIGIDEEGTLAQLRTVGTPNVGTSGWDHFIIAIMRPAGEPRFDLGPNFDVPNVPRF